MTEMADYAALIRPTLAAQAVVPRVSPQARLLRLIILLLTVIGLAAAPARIGSLGLRLRLRLWLPAALEVEEAKTVFAGTVGCNIDRGRGLARDEAALGLVAQHRDELGAVVGLGAQRLVRDDDRGSRHSGRRDPIEHLLRNGDAVERLLGVVAAVDR